MKMDNVNTWLTLAANMGVIAGIVFLAVELQQNSEMLSAQARYSRQEIRLADTVLPINNENYASALIKYSKGQDLSEYEDLLIRRGMDVTLANWQFVYTEYKQGLIEASELPISSWQSYFNNEKRSNEDYWPDLTDYWESEKNNFDSDYVSWMDENIVSP